MTDSSPGWEERYAAVVRQGGHMRFFERVFIAQGIENLVIVSPWLGSMTRRQVGYTIQDIAGLINESQIPTFIVTRSHKVEPINTEAVRTFRDCPTVNLYFNNELHAKVYVCRCVPFGFALLSSANLSQSATVSVEIGLMIEGKGYGEDVVRELEAFGKLDMPGMAGTYVEKYADRFVDRL